MGGGDGNELVDGRFDGGIGCGAGRRHFALPARAWLEILEAKLWPNDYAMPCVQEEVQCETMERVK